MAAIRSRRASSIALLAAATIAVAAAAAGPLYLSTADGTVLRARLVGTGVPQTVVNVGDYQTSNVAARLTIRARPLSRERRMGRWFGPPVYSVVATLSPKVPLVYRPGVCRHLHFISGHCPVARGQITMTARTAHGFHLHLGSTLDGYRLVGIIRAGKPNQPYWLGQDYFIFGDGNYDAAFTTRATVENLPSIATFQLPLIPSRVNANNVDQVETAVAAYESAAVEQLDLSASTRLFAAVNGYVHSADLMTVIVLVVDLQLVLLALIVLFGLVSRAAEARRGEAALAKLRGLPLWQTLTTGLAEPALLILLALPSGLILAYLLIAVAQGLLLPNSLLELQPLSLLAALVAVGGGLVAAALASRRIVLAPLAEQLRAVEGRSSPAGWAAADAAMLALALGAIVELVGSGVINGGAPNPLAAFAPGLVAVAVAVVGVRTLPLLAGLLLRRIGAGGHLALNLAVLQVVRRPASLRQVSVVALATALACFAVVGWAAAGVNRVSRADFNLGAARVLTVAVPGWVSLESAVDRADPSGRYAMAAMVSKIPSERILAVQADRLSRVAYWASGVSHTPLSQLVGWLDQPTRKELVVQGEALRATVSLGGPVSPPPDLTLGVVTNSGLSGTADFGYLRPGTHVYTAALPQACADGCRAVQLAPLWNPSLNGPQSAQFQVTVGQLGEKASRGGWRPLQARFGNLAYWTSSGSAMRLSSTNQSGEPALVMQVTENPSEELIPAASPGALPRVLHGVATNSTAVANPVATSVEDFDGTALTLNVTRRVVALPQLGAQGYLLNLSSAMRAETAPAIHTESQVWLAPDTPARVTSSLRRQGLRIVSAGTPQPAITEMDRGGPALAFVFFLLAAGAAVLLAVGSAVFSLVTSSRRRAFELAVLGAMGLSRRTLWRSLLGEQLLVLGPGIVLGVVAGLVGAVLALPSVPEFTSSIGEPPVQLVLVPLPIVVMVLLLIVVLLVAAWAAARLTARLGSSDRLRSEVT
ncbi:MAG: FtsX-like permease family protein [Acidimicrobiales bacterium]